VRSLVLPDDPQQGHLAKLGSEVWEGDVCDPTSLLDLCAGIDIVYHLAAVVVSHDPSAFERVNRDGTQHLLAAADSERVNRFIYVSSASVTYPKRTPYAQAKLEAEQLVRRRNGAYTIVRPTLVYDQHGGHELQMFLAYLRSFPVVPFIGAGGALKRPVWSEDVVSGLASIADSEAASGKTYNLSGGETIRMLDFARLLLRHHAAERPIVRLPVALCRLLGRMMAACTRRPKLTSSAIAGVIHDANLDPSEAMYDLGYRPIGVREGFERCFPRAEAAHNPLEGEGVES
jgi:NADH dehydrogenase